MGSAASKEQPSRTTQATNSMNEKEALSNFQYLSIDPNAQASTELNVSAVAKWEQKLLSDPKNRLALSAVSKGDLRKIVQQPDAIIDDVQVFSDSIDFDGSPITNQRSSGRCWIFASTSVFRVYLMKKYKLDEFELSQAYLFFWDKLEKSNYFLEQILDTTDEPIDSRTVSTLLSSPVSDGGQWDMIVNLVEKYGLVPQNIYSDSANAMSSGAMNKLITTKLREDALTLRKLAADKSNSSEDLLKVKGKMIQDIYGILVITLGRPPKPEETFKWDFLDKNKKFHSYTTTPTAFYKDFVGYHAGDHFSLINDPRHEYGKLYTVERLGNIVGGKNIRYVNVDMDTMKKACLAMIRKNNPIFFGSDVGQYSDSALGIMDTKLFDYELAFNVKLGSTKAERVLLGESAMTHAMTLNAVHVEDGKTTKWKVQNSWGETAGQKGWFVMTDRWMDEFVYQAVVSPEFVSKEITDILKTESVALPLWDPMGALA